jgi:hypothetical protein
MFPLLAKEFHLGEQQLSLLTGASVLALGYANFVIVPALTSSVAAPPALSGQCSSSQQASGKL